MAARFGAVKNLATSNHSLWSWLGKALRNLRDRNRAATKRSGSPDLLQLQTQWNTTVHSVSAVLLILAAAASVRAQTSGDALRSITAELQAKHYEQALRLISAELLISQA